jgi:hypothetical protein
MALTIFYNNFLLLIFIFPILVGILKQSFIKGLSFGMGLLLGMGETTIMFGGVCNKIKQGIVKSVISGRTLICHGACMEWERQQLC